MDIYRQMAVFAAVVRAGSMSAAAQQLGMTASAISQTISKLESQSGVRLLNRSTRKLSLTDIGQRYWMSCEKLMQAAADGQAELESARAEPTGLLRLSAPIGLGAHIETIFGAWLKEHDELCLYLSHGDGYSDMIDERIDLAVRYGNLGDSACFVRRIGTLPRLLCAAPSWAEQHKHVQHPADIPAQDWIELKGEANAKASDIYRGEEHFTLPNRTRLASNSQFTVQSLCRSGAGVALLTNLDSAEDLANGKLIRILPDWSPESLAIWALSPPSDRQPSKVSQAITCLSHFFAAHKA